MRSANILKVRILRTPKNATGRQDEFIVWVAGGQWHSNTETTEILQQTVRLLFFFCCRRDFYRQQGVPVQFTPFSKECSTLWKAMSDEEKTKYQKMAEDDRERYRRELSGFDKPLAKDGTRRGRRKKEPGQPKRNM